MEQKDQLFALIKSLSKAEKRYFTMDASRYSAKKEKNYLKLFRIFDEQEIYNTTQIKSKLKGMKMAGNLALEKHQLYEHLLESLSRFHANSAITSKLISDLKIVEVLRSKDLRDQARKIVARVKKACYDRELFEMLIQVITMQMQLVETGDHSYHEKFNAYIAEREEVWKKLCNVDLLQSKRVYLAHLQGQIGAPQNERELNMYLSFYEEVMALKPQLLSISSRNIYYRILFLYHTIMLDNKSARQANQLRYELYRNNLWLIDNDPKQYVIFLYFYIMNLAALNEFDEALVVMRHMERLREEYREHTHSETFTEIERRLVPLTIFIYGHLEYYDAIVDMKNELKQFMIKYSHELPVFRKNSLIYNVAQTFFLVGNHRECHKWLVDAVQGAESKSDYETYFFNSLLLIINCCKMKSWELAESQVLSLKRYIRQRQKENTVALDMLNMLGRYIRQDSDEGKAMELQKFYEMSGDWLKSYLGEQVYIRQWWAEHNISI